MSEYDLADTILVRAPLTVAPSLVVSAVLLMLWAADRARVYNLYWGVGQLFAGMAALLMPVSRLPDAAPAPHVLALLVFACSGLVAFLMGMAHYRGRPLAPWRAVALLALLTTCMLVGAAVNMPVMGFAYDAIGVSVSVAILAMLAPLGRAELIAGILFLMRALNGNFAVTLLPGYTQLERAQLNQVFVTGIGLALLSAGFLRVVRELQQNRESLERTVAERTAQLQAANRELEAFGHSVSHDLRAPLRALDGFSLALIEDHGASLDPQAAALARRIRAAAERMRTLIDRLFELARHSRAPLRREQVDLSALAFEIIARLRDAEPGRAVEVHIAPGLIATGDAALLGDALENLLGNAWKYTARTAAPCIEFDHFQQQGERAFVVRDNGAGFDMRYAGRLFGAFQRLHDAREFEGTGIGLATVQRIVHRHGGRIWAEAAPGAGASFFFTLPDGAEVRAIA